MRVGAGNSREDAAHLASELKQKGYPVSVVPML
ncbi:MAG: SPOR domain-containing protein [Synergistaceae bacterium]|nr:SPOR domain-containing protein [Synergistaceae bacterium]